MSKFCGFIYSISTIWYLPSVAPCALTWYWKSSLPFIVDSDWTECGLKGWERLRTFFLIYCIVRNKTREGDNSQQSRRDQTEFFLQTWTAYQYCSTQHRHANYWGTLRILSLQHLDCLSELHRTRHGLCEVAVKVCVHARVSGDPIRVYLWLCVTGRNISPGWGGGGGWWMHPSLLEYQSGLLREPIQGWDTSISPHGSRRV